LLPVEVVVVVSLGETTNLEVVVLEVYAQQ
jgi:hypothetical protein